MGYSSSILAMVPTPTYMDVNVMKTAWDELLVAGVSGLRRHIPWS